MKTFFCNRTVDKGEMKRLIKWVLLNYGTEKTTRLIDQLKTMGFHYATHAGISLGIDDLSIPPIKSAFLENAENDIYENDLRLKRGQITSVQRLEKALDIWNTTNDTLKTEVVNYFRSTNIFNPVYMMAFSGARGNISQVRQLVGMRGLMADPQGQILDFPIRRNFREGLTVTEYMISCYGARKGLVDTALRTASSGYLTRRLVDVAQSVIIQQVDCQTTQGLRITPNAKQIDSQLLGRVLFENVVDVETGRIIGYKNEDISPALALKLVKQPTLTIRSPLTCKFHAVCQLCYGWNLAQQKLVQLGEAVGVLAAQSIGEPGTQLTMRTFHTGGVFAGEATEKVYSPQSGIISYSKNVCGRKVLSKYGEVAFLTFQPLKLRLQNATQSSILNFPAFTLLYASPGQFVANHQSLAELSRVEAKGKFEQFDQGLETVYKEFTTDRSGQVFLPGLESKVLNTNIPITSNKWLEMWVLGGAITNSYSLLPGDNIKNIFQPINSLTKTTLKSVNLSLKTISNLKFPASSNSRKLVSDYLGLWKKLYLINSKLALPFAQLNFITAYKLELIKVQQQLTVGSNFNVKPLKFRNNSFQPKSLNFKKVSPENVKCKKDDFKLLRLSKEQYQFISLKSQIKYNEMAPTNCFSKSFNPLSTLSFNTLTALNFKNDKIDTFLKFPTFWFNSSKKSHFLPTPTNVNLNTFNSVVGQGGFSPSLLTYKPSETISQSTVKNFKQTNPFGEIRAKDCIMTHNDQIGFEIEAQDLTAQLGDYLRIEDGLTDQFRMPVSGQIQFVNGNRTLVRHVQPYLVVPGTQLEVQHGSLVTENDSLGKLVSAQSTAGDIVQGLPKVDELLEAREPQHKVLSSMHAKLSTLFSQYGKVYGLREGCELSFQKIRQFLVQEVQDVYQSQGVYIGDKHVEIIVRQMTTHVVVVDPGKTGLLPGDIIDIRRIEQLEHNGLFAGVKYRPILLGITRAALMAESFISAASFQETKRVLSKAALEGQIDWLTGLKENVILGRLIPAGTGLY
tara:strand:- start:1573 stop:4626 length:3054 start_codon:yes stop_codon:yes gene_type:complete